MEPNSIKLKIMSCKDLKAFNFFQKLSVYALVSVVSDDPAKKVEHPQEQRTPTDAEGDGDPEWNHEMQFNLDHIPFQHCDHLFLKFDLRHEGVMFGDKPIGEVRVPLKDLIQESNGVVRFMRYEVRSTDGKPNGVLDFCYHVIGKAKFMESSGSPTSHITGFPVVNPTYPFSEGYSAVSTHHHYPSLEFPSIYPHTYFNDSSPPPSYYPPPDTYFPSSTPIYPPPPPPPPPHVAHGEYYPFHVYPWSPDPYEGVYGYGEHRTQGVIIGHQHHQHSSNGRPAGGN